MHAGYRHTPESITFDDSNNLFNYLFNNQFIGPSSMAATPPAHQDTIRTALRYTPQAARALAERLGVSQPTVSRTLQSMAGEIVSFGRARSIQYALRDTVRGMPEFPVYRVGPNGALTLLGQLVPVRPEGFVMQQSDGLSLYSECLPRWLIDMRPQGFLGRAYARAHSATLGLPPNVDQWNDAQAMRALLAQGAEAVGNLVLGDHEQQGQLVGALGGLVGHLLESVGLYGSVDSGRCPSLVASTERGASHPRISDLVSVSRQ